MRRPVRITIAASLSSDQLAGDVDQPIENRRSPRKASSVPALIGIPGARLTIPCRLLNTSGLGCGTVLTLDAKSRIRSTFDLPDTVTLIMPHERAEIDCVIQWRDGVRLGAVFKSRIRPHVARPL